MDTMIPADLQSLIAPWPGPCVSLYIPLHAGGNEQDSILWKNTVREAEELVTAAGLRGSETADLFRPASRMFGDAEFWREGGDGGLACFLSPGFDVPAPPGGTDRCPRTNNCCFGPPPVRKCSTGPPLWPTPCASRSARSRSAS
jgi:hypothetical protein